MEVNKSRARRKYVNGRTTMPVEVKALLTMAEALEAFLQYKLAERTAPRTIQIYRRHVNYLNQWLQDNGRSTRLVDITRDDVADYIRWMTYEKKQYDGHPYGPKNETIGLSPVTVNIRMRSLKAFFNWCIWEEYLIKSPMGPLNIRLRQRLRSDVAVI